MRHGTDLIYFSTPRTAATYVDNCLQSYRRTGEALCDMLAMIYPPRIIRVVRRGRHFCYRKGPKS